MVGDTKSEMTFPEYGRWQRRGDYKWPCFDSQRFTTLGNRAVDSQPFVVRVSAGKSKPELEIYADDVTASHGCTVGSLNKTDLFYLKSRGLSEADARAFLQYAFAGKIIGEIQHQDIRSLVETQLLGELQHGGLIGELKESVNV